MLHFAATGGASCVREGRPSTRCSPLLYSFDSDWNPFEERYRTSSREVQVTQLQDELCRLGSEQAHAELSMGEGLELLSKAPFDLRDLGHSSFKSLCTGLLGFSASHGRALRTLSTNLLSLPLLRRAFLAGLISRTRIRAVIKVATPKDEAAWARLAMQLSSRQLEQRVNAIKHERTRSPEGACAPETEADDSVAVSWHGTQADKGLWQFILAAVRQVLGGDHSEAECAEMLAAECLSNTAASLPERGFDMGLAEATRSLSQELHPAPERKKALAPADRGALRKVLRALDRISPPGQEETLPPAPEFYACERSVDVLDHLLVLSRRLKSIAKLRAKLLWWSREWFFFLEHGFVTFHEWIERTVGLSPREAQQLVDLQDQTVHLPALEDAWCRDELTTSQVARLCQIAGPSTVGAWVAFARDNTPKLLEAAVEHALAQANLSESAGSDALPPQVASHAELLLSWQTQFSVQAGMPKTPAGGACALTPAAEGSLAAPDLLRLQAAPEGRYRIGFRAPRAVALLFCEAIAQTKLEFGAFLSDSDALRLMVAQFLSVHVNDEVKKHARQHRIMERDGWTCTMPHCRARSPLHAHHIRYRSRGGGDEESNLTTLCEPCHAMVHAGNVVLFGCAPEGLVFLLGTRREVYRGERRLRRDLASLGESVNREDDQTESSRNGTSTRGSP